MPIWEAGFSGVYGGAYRLRVEVTLLFQEAGNNRSRIRYTAYMVQVGSSQYLIATSGITANTNINGYNPGRGGALRLNAQGARHYIAQNEDYWIGHDAAGNANPTFGANLNTNRPEVNYAATNNHYPLPKINRYATITSFNIEEVTDTAIQFSWTSDSDVSSVHWWSTAYDGGGHKDIPASGRGVFRIRLENLTSNKDYDITVEVRRADSGLYTASGTAVVRTSSQARMIDASGL